MISKENNVYAKLASSTLKKLMEITQLWLGNRHRMLIFGLSHVFASSPLIGA
jgi:hypothetical protein